MKKSELRKLIKEELSKFPKFLKEEQGVNWNVDVNEPYNEKDEFNQASTFVISNPITLTTVEGQIDDDKTYLTLIFSNGDQIDYEHRFSGPSAVNLTTIDSSLKEKNFRVDKIFERMQGSTGTVVGDLCLVYKEYYNKKGK